MKKNILLWLLPVVVILQMLNCKKLDENLQSNDFIVNDAPTVIAGVNGMVVDEQNNPINGVTVVSGNSTTTTGRFGEFRFSNIAMSKTNATVKVSRPGYFTAYRTFIATAGRMHQVRIKLIPKTNSGSFSAVTGGTINLAGGGRIVIPANAVTDALGNAYSGTVNVAATWLNPSAPDLAVTIPGDLRGVTTGGRERVLETYGMLGAEMTGSSGQALKIASGRTAELTFPIPATAQASAPATIPLWYFDEPTARWREQGRANRNGNIFVGRVNNLAFWNVDVDTNPVKLCIRLLSVNNTPVVNAQIRLSIATRPDLTTGTGITDLTNGEVCGYVPPGEVLSMDILVPCGNTYVTVFSGDIGPFDSNRSITQVVNIASLLNIRGRLVDCNNNAVVNGEVTVFTGGNNYYRISSRDSGSFSLTHLFCGAATGYVLRGFDKTNNRESDPVTGSVSGGSVNIGTLQVCNNVSTAQFVQMTINGTSNNWTAPSDTVRTILSSIVSPAQTRTGIRALKNNDPQNWMHIEFQHAEIPGSYPITSCTISSPLGFSNSFVITPTNITLTEVTSLYIAGNFSAPMTFTTGQATRPVTCSFRCKRL
jgi:hypothetical protein